MKILFLDAPAFAKQDMIDAFTECGITYELFSHKAYKERFDRDYEDAFDQKAESAKYDFVFSFNYYPILSKCCQKHNLKYVSYVYDSPLVALYSCTIINPCNYVFIFDKVTYEALKNEGIATVHYLPLAANVKRLLSVNCDESVGAQLKADVSFVGSLYNEDHNLYERLSGITDYTRGYLEGVMAAQQRLYGCFLMEELLTPDIISDMQKAVPYAPMPDGAESLAYVYANYFLARKVTSNERISLLKLISEQFELKLYTHQPSEFLPKAHFMGTVDYYDTMPLVFQNSKINLNISLKSIQSGIPLRCMDIMGSGGFLLTNFQEDFLDYFLPGEDFVYYDSEEDCKSKIEYYLSNEAQRRQIAANAIGKMEENHTFLHRVKQILDIL